MMYQRTLALLLILGFTAPATAQNLISQLPADGNSARFLLEIKGKRGDMDMSAKGTLNISSVGSETVDQQPCRWIEIYYTTTSDKRAVALTEKLLVPEKYCKLGEAPLAHVVKAYIQRGNRDVEPLADALDALVSPIPILLGGPLENQKSLGKKLVESKIGKLSCEGFQGDFKYQKDARQLTCQVQVWRHEKAPFGVVQAELKDVKIGDQVTFSMSLVLNTVLKNTRSRLPDLK